MIGEANPHQKLEELIQQKLIARKRVLDFSMFLDPCLSKLTSKICFPGRLHQGIQPRVRRGIERSELTVDDLVPHPRMIERINQWLKAAGIRLRKDGGFNHYRVAQAVLPALRAATLKPDELKRFERPV